MFAMLPHTQSDKEREHVKGDVGSTQVLASSMRPVVSCISMVSDSSNGLSNISTFWSDGWPSTSDSLEGEDVVCIVVYARTTRLCFPALILGPPRLRAMFPFPVFGSHPRAGERAGRPGVDCADTAEPPCQRFSEVCIGRVTD